MNERYLFRGKRLDNNEWVQGYHSWDSTITVNHGMDMDTGSAMWDEYEVDPSTVGQCTGLRDKNGTLIFEGDIVKWGHIEGYGENPYRIAQVVLNPDIQYHSQIGVFRHGNFVYADMTDKALEVIGSIHTTPELMEGNNGTD